MGSHTCIALDLNPGGRGISMPPPGVVPNFAHPTTRAGSLLAINIVCLAVAGLFVAARHYSKYYLGTRKLDLDDAITILAMFFSVLFSIAVMISTRHGWGTHCWELDKRSKPGFLKSEIAVTSLYAVAIFIVKAAILFLYIRIFDSSRTVKYTAWALFLFMFGHAIASFFLSIFPCRPVRAYWTSEPSTCINTFVLGYISAVISIVTDIAIFVLPLPQIWRMRLPLRVRLQVIAVLATGLLTCAVTVIRIISFADLYKQFDITWHTYSALLWTVLEVNLGIICACMPTLKPLLRHHLPAIFASTVDSGPSTFMQTPSSGFSKPSKQPPYAGVSEFDDIPLYVNGGSHDDTIELGVRRQGTLLSDAGTTTPQDVNHQKYPFPMI